jgi:hypothetical protein
MLRPAGRADVPLCSESEPARHIRSPPSPLTFSPAASPEPQRTASLAPAVAPACERQPARSAAGHGCRPSRGLDDAACSPVAVITWPLGASRVDSTCRRDRRCPRPRRARSLTPVRRFARWRCAIFSGRRRPVRQSPAAGLLGCCARHDRRADRIRISMTRSRAFGVVTDLALEQVDVADELGDVAASSAPRRSRTGVARPERSCP